MSLSRVKEDAGCRHHLDQFREQFLVKRINTKNAFSSSGRLHFLRRFLQTQRIPFNLVLSVMERHAIIDTIKPTALTNLLHDIFYAADKLDLIAGHFDWRRKEEKSSKGLDPDYQARLLASLLWSVFDPIHLRTISILELKMSLLLLCSTNSPAELIQHLLHLLVDHNRCIHQPRFKSCVQAILKLFHYLNHQISCDPEMISTLVRTSFEKVTGLAGLSDTQFYNFWNTENRKNPNEISYFFTLILFSRSLESDTVHEAIACVGCTHEQKDDSKISSSSSIRGVRFKCSRCPSFNLCAFCFLSDFKTARHNPETHKFLLVQENQPPAIEEEEKGTNLFTKLLKVFYFLRVRKDRSSGGGDKMEEDEKTVINPKIHFEEEKGMASSLKSIDEDDGLSNGKDKLFTVIEMLEMENKLFQENLEQIQKTCNPDSEFHKYLEQHKRILSLQIEHLRKIWTKSAQEKEAITPVQKFHSTPFRPNMRSINWDLTALDASTVTTAGQDMEKSKYIRGEEMNKTYFEANRSDRSLQEISTWLHLRESFCRDNCQDGSKVNKSGIPGDDGMKSFRDLLHKVRDILEDTYSDNAQLSTVTRQLETVLDNIIGEEERKIQVRN